MIFLTLSDIFTDTGVQLFGSPMLFGLIILIVLLFVMLLLNMPVGFLLLAGGLTLVFLSFLDSGFNIFLAIFGVITGAIILLLIWKMFQSGD